MKAEEKKAIEWLKNKHEECTNLIASCSYIGNKKAYAKDRTQYKILINLVEKQEKITDNSISKDKIRAKIEYYENALDDDDFADIEDYLKMKYGKEVLAELLKEA